MLKITRLRRELVDLPKRGEEFMVDPGEATIGSILVEKIFVSIRHGEEIVHIWGFG